MKLILSLFVVSNIAYACPNLAGVYECGVKSWEKWTQKVSESRDQYGNIVYDGLDFYPIIIDGKTRKIPDTHGSGGFSYKSSCTAQEVRVIEIPYYPVKITKVYSLDMNNNLKRPPSEWGTERDKSFIICIRK